jgi:hypothetical protein
VNAALVFEAAEHVRAEDGRARLLLFFIINIFSILWTLSPSIIFVFNFKKLTFMDALAFYYFCFKF